MKTGKKKKKSVGLSRKRSTAFKTCHFSHVIMGPFKKGKKGARLCKCTTVFLMSCFFFFLFLLCALRGETALHVASLWCCL